MDPETQLDALLSQRNARRDARQTPPTAAQQPDDEVRELLAVADRLAQLRVTMPSVGFTRALESRLLAHADEVKARMGAPDELTQADLPRAPRPIRPAASPHSTAASADPTGQTRARRSSAGVSYARWGAIAAAVLLALGVGTYAAAATADASSPFYGVQGWQHGVQVVFASGQDRARLHIQYANDALDQLNAAARNGNDGAYTNALNRLNDEEQAAQSSLKTVSDDGERNTLTAQLNDLHGRMRHDLAAALPQIGWPNRVATTTALANLGVSGPRVTSITISRPRGSGSGSSADEHAWQVVVNGSGFASGAALYLDGQATGKVTSVTSSRLVAIVQSDDLAKHARAVGVGNPNGAAAQTKNIIRQDDSSGTGSEESHGDKTPTPAATTTATPDGSSDGH